MVAREILRDKLQRRVFNLKKLFPIKILMVMFLLALVGAIGTITVY
jgi:hypothetical protein